MRKNFTERDFAEVVVGDLAIDIHNLYQTSSISTDLVGETFTLVLRRNDQIAYAEGLPEQVTLTCSGGLRIAFNEIADQPVRLIDDAVELAYFSTGCEWDQMLGEDLAVAQGFDGLHIMFSAGCVLRIWADLAEISTSGSADSEIAQQVPKPRLVFERSPDGP